MILNNTEELKKHIPVSKNFAFDDFEPYIQKAVNSYLYQYVGDLHETLAEVTAEAAENAVIKNKARKYLQSAIANFGYFLFLPFASVQIDGSGLSNIVNENRKNLEWWQRNDIGRELLRSGHEAMDFLLAILEANPTVFTDWTENYADKNKELLIHCTADFQEYYNIFNSRQTYLALVPAMRQVEDQYIKTFICGELITALKSEPSHDKIKLAKEYVQKAIVAFTIAKVYDEGIFNLDASGIKLKFDTLPNETLKAVDYGKPADQLTKAVKKQIDNGTNYISMVKQIITENPTVFTQCDSPLLHKTPTKFEVYNTQGVVGL